jgi:hypothetical protein
MPEVEATRIEAWNNPPFLPDLRYQMFVVQTEAVRKSNGHSVTEFKTPVNGITIYLHSFNSHFSQLHFY